jgi:hypothetical protein
MAWRRSGVRAPYSPPILVIDKARRSSEASFLFLNSVFVPSRIALNVVDIGKSALDIFEAFGGSFDDIEPKTENKCCRFGLVDFFVFCALR